MTPEELMKKAKRAQQLQDHVYRRTYYRLLKPRGTFLSIQSDTFPLARILNNPLTSPIP